MERAKRPWPFGRKRKFIWLIVLIVSKITMSFLNVLCSIFEAWYSGKTTNQLVKEVLPVICTTKGRHYWNLSDVQSLCGSDIGKTQKSGEEGLHWEMDYWALFGLLVGWAVWYGLRNTSLLLILEIIHELRCWRRKPARILRAWIWIKIEMKMHAFLDLNSTFKCSRGVKLNNIAISTVLNYCRMSNMPYKTVKR